MIMWRHLHCQALSEAKMSPQQDAGVRAYPDTARLVADAQQNDAQNPQLAWEAAEAHCVCTAL